MNFLGRTRRTRHIGTLIVMFCAAAGVLAGPPVMASQLSLLVIGGSEVAAGKYPFMVSMQHNGEHVCGGSLLNSGVVITAAHCAEIIDEDEALEWQLVVNAVNLSNPTPGQARNLDLREGLLSAVRVHPKYGRENGYDLALLFLDKPVNGVTPVKLPTPGTDALLRPGQTATVAGWGNTDTDLGNQPDRLREVTVPFLSHDECELSYPDSYNRATEICAGVEGKDSCQGDSGGPLFRQINGVTYQVGVVSYGNGCAGQGAPGVYTSLSSKVLWDSLDGDAGGSKTRAFLEGAHRTD